MGKYAILLGMLLIIGGFVLYAVFNTEDQNTLVPSASPSISLSPSVSALISPNVSLTPPVLSSPIKTKTPTPTTQRQTHTIRFTANGVTPKTIVAKIGDMVKFINEDQESHLPKSDPHPFHTSCPEMNASAAISTGQSFTFIVTQSRTCEFHDHLNPFTSEFRGNITRQ